MPPSETERARSSWPRRILRALVLVFNLFLVLTLFVQGGLIFWLWPNGEINVPASVLERVNEELAEEGFRFKAEQLHFDLRGYIALRDVSLGFTDGEHEVVSAEQVLISFKPWELLIGRFSIDGARIISGQIECPPVLSPTGVKETIVKDITLSASMSRGIWHVDPLNLETAGFRISVNGDVPASIFKGGSKKDKQELTKNELESGYQDFCRYVLDIQEKTQGLEEPLLLVELSAQNRKELGIHATFLTEGYKLPNGASIGQNTTVAHLILDEGMVLRSEEPATAIVHDLNWPDYAQCKLAQMQVTLNKGPDGVVAQPDYVTLFMYQLESEGLSFEGALALADFNKMPILDLHMALKDGDNWLDCYGDIDTLKQSADMTLAGRWDPKFFLQANPLKENKDIPTLTFSSRPYFRAHALLSPSWKFERAWVQLDCGAASYESLNIESLITNAIITPDTLTLKNTTIRTKDYTVSGQYKQDLNTNDYRFIITGNLRPLDIGFIVDEDWWNELWQDFQFSNELPSASLDLSGRYGGGLNHKVMFCRADLPACKFRGVDLTSASTYIWRKNLRLDIMDLFLQSDSGNSLADLHWQYTPKGKDRLYLSFLGSSTMQQTHLAKLIGPEAEPYGDLFTSSTAPTTRAAGLIYGDDSKEPGALYLKVLADFEKETVFEDITFERVSMQALSTPEAVTISDVDAVLASGKLTGNAKITGSGENHNLSLDLDLKNASLYGLFTVIPPLKEMRDASNAESSTDEPSKTEKKLTPEERYAGNLNLSFKGQGELGKVESFNGQGSLSLWDAHLGRLHLFGGLSRLLDGLGIGFGTVDFTAAETDYTINAGNLHIPDGKISGPTARIDTNGYYMIQEDQLDFILSLYPLGGISVPLVSTVLSVLDPISNTIEVQLKGPISDPKWSTNFGLMRAITGQQKVQDPNGSKQKSSSSSSSQN